MDRIKRIELVILLSLTVFILQACDNSAGSETVEENKDLAKYFAKLPSGYDAGDEPIICINKLNVENYSGKTLRPGFLINILSGDELTEKDVKINIHVNTPYVLIHQSSEKVEGKFDDYVCLNYNNTDWAKLKELELDISEEGQEELGKIKESINNEYESIDEDGFPKFYNNEFFVQFDMTGDFVENEDFGLVQVVIGEDSYDIDVGHVGLNYSYESPSSAEYGEHVLLFTGVGRIGYNILQNKEGIIDLYGYEAAANKDIKIKNLRLMNAPSSMKIDNAEINIVSEDITINRKWESGKDIDVTKGSKLYFDFIIKDEEFAKVQNYATNIYVLVEYEIDGKRYVSGVQALCESRYDGQTLYAMYKDGIDMSEYYTVYYN